MATAAGDATDRVLPKHVRIREYLRRLATEAEPGSPAPSERELVRTFGVARMTVRQAVDALVAEGVLERVPGRGTFVARNRVDLQARLAGFTEEMTRRGLRPESRTLVARAEAAGPGVARALQLAEGAPVIHWHRLRLADGVPMCVEHAYVAEHLLPGFLAGPLPDSLYAEFDRRGLTPTWGEDSVGAGMVTAEEAGLLEIDAPCCVLRISRRAFADDVALEVSRSTFRADRYTLWIPLVRV